MKITRVTGTPVRLSLPKPLYDDGKPVGTKNEWGRLSRFSPKRPDPILEYLVVRIETDEGTVGIGDAQADIGFFGNNIEGVTAAVVDYMGPQIVGMDPLDRKAVMHKIDYRGNSCAKAGIDLALHDLVGKIRGVPVYELLGGSHRDRVKVAIEIAGDAPDRMAAHCVALMEKGVRAFKPKIGGIPEDDADRLQAIREAVGRDVSIRADANQGYTPEEAILLCKLAEDRDLGLELLEQPVPTGDLEGLARVRQSVDTLIEADESAFSPSDVKQIIRWKAADVINIKIGKAGGLLKAMEIAALTEQAGLKCVLGTAFGLGTETAAKLHLTSAIPIVVDAVEFTELDQHDSMLAPPYSDDISLPLSDGCLPVPTGPGLGVAMDEDKIARHTFKLG